MSESGEEPKGETQDTAIGLDDQVSRSDFLKKLIAGGVVSVAALSGVGGLQKVFADNDKDSIASGNTSDIAGLIQQINQLRKQLGDLQTQFTNVISGKQSVSEMIVNKLTVPGTDGGFMKIESDASFLKLNVPDTGFLKINGDASFLKLTVPESDGGFMKIESEASFLKLTVPGTDGGFMKIESEASFLKLDVPENGFLKIDGEAAFIKLDATEIVAQKVVAGSITTETPTTTAS